MCRMQTQLPEQHYNVRPQRVERSEKLTRNTTVLGTERGLKLAPWKLRNFQTRARALGALLYFASCAPLHST